MIDPGTDIMRAAENAGIPCWRGAWKAESSQDRPPDQYAVYTIHRSPGESCDDAVRYTRCRAYISLYGAGDLSARADRLEEELGVLGWLCTARDDRHDDQADANILSVTAYTEVDA